MLITTLRSTTTILAWAIWFVETGRMNKNGQCPLKLLAEHRRSDREVHACAPSLPERNTFREARATKTSSSVGVSVPTTVAFMLEIECRNESNFPLHTTVHS